MENGMKSALKKVMIAAAVLVAGCANTTDPAIVGKMTKSIYDPYLKQTTVLADMVIKRNYFGVDRLLYRLKAEIRNGADPVLQLYVGTDYDDSGVFYFASDIDAIVLPVLQINSQTADKAPAAENVAVTLSRPYLDSHKTTGLNIRLTGNRGSLIVEVPGPYIEGFLAKLDEVRSKPANVAVK
jgi:hypothetical protein